MRILVTGAAGYIGSVLCAELLRAGHGVIALDSFRYKEAVTALAMCCADPDFALVRGDARNISLLQTLVRHVDVVFPLAALVGAPLCASLPQEAVSVNREAVALLVGMLRPDQLIIYPNTNSGYGSMQGRTEALTEDEPLHPLSVYADSKCKAENLVLEHPNSCVFRLATVFGASPRMRTDLLVNDFTLRAMRDKGLILYDPQARRNFVHVRDVVDAFLWALAEDWRLSTYRVFNLGHDGSNCSKVALCDKIGDYVPGFCFAIGKGADPDKRDYVVSNQRLRDAGFEAQRDLDYGIEELVKLYRGFPFTSWGNV